MRPAIFIWLVLACSCVFAQAEKPATQPVKEPVRLRVLGDSVNLRATPDVATGGVIGQANFHEILTLVTYREDWAQVRRPKGMQAWVHGDYLFDGNIVKSRTLRVRSGPSTEHPVLAELERNTTVELVSTNSTNRPWVQINADHLVSAWIHKDFIEELAPEPKPEVAAKPEPKRPPVIPPPGVKIDPSKPQGLRMKTEGMVHFHPQIGYYVANAQGGVLCTLRVPEAEIRRYTRKQVYVEGQSFWMPGVTAPLLVPSRISEIVVYQRQR